MRASCTSGARTAGHGGRRIQMAKIVFGLGTSHTPMLLADDETLPRFVETDRLMKHRDKEGHPIDLFGELLEKADPRLAAHDRARSSWSVRQNKARARRSSILRPALTPGQPRRADRDGRRPERKLQGGLPARLRDLLRRHHPQQQRAARVLSRALARNGTCRTARPSSSRRSRATIRCIPISPCISSNR